MFLGVVKQEANWIVQRKFFMGCQLGQNTDVIGDIAKTTSPLLGIWIY